MPAIIGKCFSVNQVFHAMKDQQTHTYNRKIGMWCVRWPQRLYLGGNQHPLSRTLKVLYRLGVRCRYCGIEAEYFQQERFSLQKPWHLVPYGLDFDGNPVRITKDHIVPKTAGGPRANMLNLQILCKDCNECKGSLVPAVLPPDLQELVDFLSSEEVSEGS